VDVPELPLGLTACADCSHGQLTHFVDPTLLFGEYLYKSGTSQTLRDFFEWFYAAVRPLTADARVLEIASNDGSLLRHFAEAGFTAIGVEPALNVAEEATASGLNVIRDFFPTTALAGEQFDLVLGLNVVAHNPAPLDFLRGVARSLGPTGVAVLQTSQAQMVPRAEFDTIYHEHYSFFTPRSMEALARRAELELVKTSLTDVHGTSFVWVLAKPGSRPRALAALDEGRFAVRSSVLADLVTFLSGRDPMSLYSEFAQAARRRLAATASEIEQRRAEGFEIVLVGAAAKAITFARAGGIRPDRVLDEAPDKIGRWVPGLDVRIERLAAAGTSSNRALFVLSAWNFADELARKVRSTQAGPADFLVYFPELRRFRL
jgi:2-polyprenyl-3-methyl-5-hydroxy-6-metoxy-1,4-benzoquinol methylase